jgi:hypothetical protein
LRALVLPVDARFRGHDGCSLRFVIPAEAGIHRGPQADSSIH